MTYEAFTHDPTNSFEMCRCFDTPRNMLTMIHSWRAVEHLHFPGPDLRLLKLLSCEYCLFFFKFNLKNYMYEWISNLLSAKKRKQEWSIKNEEKLNLETRDKHSTSFHIAASAFAFCILSHAIIFASSPSILLTNSKHIHQHLKEHGKFITVSLASQIPIFDDRQSTKDK